MQLMAHGGAIGFELNPRGAPGRSSRGKRLVHGGGDARLAGVGQVLPNNGVHEHARGVVGLRQRQLLLNKVGCIGSYQVHRLRANHGDASVEASLLAALHAPAAITRLQAAHALMALGERASDAVGEAIVDAARDETSAAVFHELVYAHLHTRAGCPTTVRGIRTRVHTTETKDAALLLLAGCYGELTPSLRREVGQGARGQLAARSPISRATAAWSLARMGDGRATRTLLSRLENESDPWVRRAMARAIWVLAAPEHAAEARGVARIEGDARAAAWLREAGRGTLRGRRFAARGDEILRVQPRPVDPLPEGLVVEVRLGDGRALRVTTFPDGLLLIPDLAAGTADVEVVPTGTLSTR